jgi:AcrR family transcriptional regulator
MSRLPSGRYHVNTSAPSTGEILPPADSPFQSPQQRSKARAAKREAVLRAAVQMFNERGFHQTSLDDVAASLGISKPTIYHYLGNKDQVLLECVTIGCRNCWRRPRIAAQRERQGAAPDRVPHPLCPGQHG